MIRAGQAVLAALGPSTSFEGALMKILTWAAVAVTALFALMNLGASVVSHTGVDTWQRIVAGLLCAAGVAAAIGLATTRSWGRVAVIAVGAVNVLVSLIALVTDQEGAVVGIVVGGLGVLFGALVRSDQRPALSMS